MRRGRNIPSLSILVDLGTAVCFQARSLISSTTSTTSLHGFSEMDSDHHLQCLVGMQLLIVAQFHARAWAAPGSEIRRFSVPPLVLLILIGLMVGGRGLPFLTRLTAFHSCGDSDLTRRAHDQPRFMRNLAHSRDSSPRLKIYTYDETRRQHPCVGRVVTSAAPLL